MQERLNRITEDFKSANDLKKELETKEIKTQDDIEQLEIIKTWLEELKIEINSWAEDYNNQQVVSIEHSKEKSLQEQFYDNGLKIDEVKYESKDLQPKFNSTNKKHKHEILESLGFIETQTVDNRKIQIHPTLVGKYYDLVKEQRRLLEQIKEERKQQLKEERKQQLKDKEQELQINIERNQQELSKIIEGRGLGKKDYIKHNGLNYWIPKTYINRFRALMHEQKLLSKELEQIQTKMKEQSKLPIDKGGDKKSLTSGENDKKLKIIDSLKDAAKIDGNPKKSKEKDVVSSNGQRNDDIFKGVAESFNNQLEELAKINNAPEGLKSKKSKEKDIGQRSDKGSNNNELLLPMVLEEVQEIKKGSTKLIEKIKKSKNEIIKKVIDILKGTNIYKKYKEYIERKQKIEASKQVFKNIENSERRLDSINERIEYLQEKPLRTPEEDNDLQQLINIKNNIENKLQQLDENQKLLNEEIKSITKPKSNMKEKRKNNIKRIIVGIGLAVALAAGIKSCNTNNIENTKLELEKDNKNENTDDSKEDTTAEEINQELESEETYYVKDEQYKVTGEIYDNMYDAANQTNGKTAYFGENTKGHIVGWGVKIGDEMIFVRRNDPNHKEKLEHYINKGAQIMSYAISDSNDSEKGAITGFYYNGNVSRRSR